LAGERVGYLHYRRGDRAISLFLLRQRPWPAQGERVQVRAVEFRVFHLGGLNAVAWNHAPLSYVLVSDLAGRGSQACAVCHSVGGAGFTFPDGDQI
jgi:anti-sigma factor RsiW